MDNLPNKLKVLRTAFLFDHSIEKFPDSIEDMRLNYKFAQKIHKFLKKISSSVSHDIIFIDVNYRIIDIQNILYKI